MGCTASANPTPPTLTNAANTLMTEVVPPATKELAKAVEDKFGFPVSVGPFTMASTDLSYAFNTFYRLHSSFPRPDPDSNESSMIGMDPHSAGMGGGDVIFGQISPLHRITLDDEAKKAANIPASAVSFAWAYPMVVEANRQLPADDTRQAFITYGGYIYFGREQSIVATNSIRPAPLGTLGLMFGRAQELPKAVADTLTKQGRFQEISLRAFADKGATHFAWIRPGEFQDSQVASFDGCFAYKFDDGRLRYFPVVSRPIFTQDFLDEKLDDHEAWVILREMHVKKLPVIERAIILEKTQSLDDNVLNAASNDVEIHPGFSRVSVHKESRPNQTITYEEWAQSVDPGSYIDPWVFTFSHAAAL